MGDGAMKTFFQIAVVVATVVSLSGCFPLGEWRPYNLHNPATGQETACYTSWGISLSRSGSSLPTENLIALHQCINECRANGFVMSHPDELPILPPGTDV